MRCPTALLPLLVALSFSPLSFARAEAHPSRVELAHSKRFSKVLREVPGAQVVERDSTGLAVREGEEKMRLSKRSTVYSGRGTYFEVGLGACGATSVDSDFVSSLLPRPFPEGIPLTRAYGNRWSRGFSSPVRVSRASTNVFRWTLG